MKKIQLDKIVNLLVLLSLLFSISCMALYFFKFGVYGFSKDTQEWARFGSFLSGIFSPIAGVTIIVTIFIFKRQSDERRKLEISKKFDNHQKEFINSIHEIEEIFDGNYKVVSKNELYKRIFPENNKNHLIESKELKEKNYYRHELEGMIEQYIKIEKISQDDFFVDTFSLLLLMFDLSYNLNIKRNSDDKEGEITILGRKSMFNFFTIEMDLYFLYKLISMLVIFTKNSTDNIRPINREKNIKTMLFISACHGKNKNKDAEYNLSKSTRIIINAYNYAYVSSGKIKDIHKDLAKYLYQADVGNEKERKRMLRKVREAYLQTMNQEERDKILKYIY